MAWWYRCSEHAVQTWPLSMCMGEKETEKDWAPSWANIVERPLQYTTPEPMMMYAIPAPKPSATPNARFSMFGMPSSGSRSIRHMASSPSISLRKSRSRRTMGTLRESSNMDSVIPPPRTQRPAFRPLELSIYIPGNELPDILAYFEAETVALPSAVHHKESWHRRSQSAWGQMETVAGSQAAGNPSRNSSIASSNDSYIGTFQRPRVSRLLIPQSTAPTNVLSLPVTPQDFDNLLDENASPPVPLRMAPTSAGLRVVPRSPGFASPSSWQQQPESPQIDVGSSLATNFIVPVWQTQVSAPRPARSATVGTTKSASTASTSAPSHLTRTSHTHSRASSPTSTVFSMNTSASVTTTPLVGSSVPAVPRLPKRASLLASVRRSFYSERTKDADAAIVRRPAASTTAPAVSNPSSAVASPGRVRSLAGRFGAQVSHADVGLAISNDAAGRWRQAAWEKAVEEHARLRDMPGRGGRSNSVGSECASETSSWWSAIEDEAPVERAVGMAL